MDSRLRANLSKLNLLDPSLLKYNLVDNNNIVLKVKIYNNGQILIPNCARNETSDTLAKV